MPQQEALSRWLAEVDFEVFDRNDGGHIATEFVDEDELAEYWAEGWSPAETARYLIELYGMPEDL